MKKLGLVAATLMILSSSAFAREMTEKLVVDEVYFNEAISLKKLLVEKVEGLQIKDSAELIEVVINGRTISTNGSLALGTAKQ